jgi:hypothetical protein
MKTATRENPNRWASDRAHGAAGQNRSCSFKWAAKQENSSRRDVFSLDFPFYRTLLTQNREDVKVVQELLRHANSRITLDLYAQAGMDKKRLAQSKLVGQVPKKGAAGA